MKTSKDLKKKTDGTTQFIPSCIILYTMEYHRQAHIQRETIWQTFKKTSGFGETHSVTVIKLCVTEKLKEMILHIQDNIMKKEKKSKFNLYQER